MPEINNKSLYGPLTDDASLGLRLANIQVTKDLVAAFRPLGLTPAQFAALTLIQAHGMLPMGELGRLLTIQKPNLTALLAPLLDRELIERQQHKRDRRQRLLRLTPAGEALLVAAEETRRAHVARLTRFLGEEEYGQLAQLLRRLAQYEAPAA
ncbi:MAG: MarR family transcriptional regulator [Spongiibacteraceae bacterium]|jgi:DNA-binding MarR family transcriptional regulator|nr:MarR family transcriptional regulator [Spongiibacteraceae bacterium]